MNAVILVAGGSGARIGGAVPKQYLELKGKALIIHTLDRFLEYDPGIRVVLVMAEGHGTYWDQIARSHAQTRDVILALGGESRFASVKNGLDHIGKGWLVGIHDAVRPLVSLETISRCYGAAEESGSAIPVLEMDESVRMVGPGGRSENLDRSRLKRVQTPQVFRSELIKQAYEQCTDPSFTDDASVFESLHGEPRLVEGNPENIKITYPADLKLASLIL
jgi:2-C-methyl-D-erythritol 4-phosphate cytidylyltransferase